MTNLQQSQYEDDNGRPVSASSVECLAPYLHISDGFYCWTCGSCGHEHSDRWHNISGRVLACDECKKLNLLVRTNCADITEAVSRKNELDGRHKEFMRLLDIQSLNFQQKQEIKTAILSKLRSAVDAMLQEQP